MKRVFFLQLSVDKGDTIWYLVRNGHNYAVTLYPSKATWFDTFELACNAQKCVSNFSIKFVDVCLK